MGIHVPIIEIIEIAFRQCTPIRSNVFSAALKLHSTKTETNDAPKNDDTQSSVNQRGRVYESGLEIRGSNGSKCYHVFSFATGKLMW